MGRGVAAAAAMAQMRAAVRAFASVDPTPAVVVAKLDHMLTRYGTDQLVTLVYAVADRRAGTLVLANAGHPPPMVLRADGDVEQLAFADGPPLGVSPADRGESTVPFAVGDTVVAFTDGLVERRDEDIDEGLARLRGAIGGLGSLSRVALADGLRRLVATVRDERYDDDIAVLALRRIC
jgi:serine phosphatase RsbU (regulator of sigma subunit)